MAQSDDDDWYPIRLFAFRLVGDEGWTIGEEAMELDQVAEAIRRRGHAFEEIREISCGSGRARNEIGEPDLGDVGFWQAQSAGWAFDDVADCWRAPGENVTRFESTPKSATTLDVEFGAPHSGWLPIGMIAGDQRFEIEASDVYPPFEDLIAWLESLVEAEEARFTVDLEGSHAEFFSFETGSVGRLRIVVALSGNMTEDGRRKIVFDIDVDRAKFVDTLYRSLRTYANGPDFNRYEWSAVTIFDDLQETYPDLPTEQLPYFRASEINEILWKLYPRHIASFPEKESKSEEIRAFAEWVIDGQKEDREGLVLKPNPQFLVPEEFDSWDTDERRAHLNERLQESITSWDGEDLRTLRSEKIERFLGLVPD